jgi:hypothetical protein
VCSLEGYIFTDLARKSDSGLENEQCVTADYPFTILNVDFAFIRRIPLCIFTLVDLDSPMPMMMILHVVSKHAYDPETTLRQRQSENNKSGPRPMHARRLHARSVRVRRKHQTTFSRTRRNSACARPWNLNKSVQQPEPNKVGWAHREPGPSFSEVLSSRSETTFRNLSIPTPNAALARRIDSGCCFGARS